MRSWLVRNLSHGIEWCCDAAKINVQKTSSGGVSVYISPKPVMRNTTPTIALHVIRAYEGRYEVADLLGNGQETDWHNKKYGTLAVNLAIQALLVLNGDKRDSIEVFGRIVPDLSPNSVQYAENTKLRNYFWSRFGFVLKEPNNPETTFRAVLSDLKCLDRGDVEIGLPTTLSLFSFWHKMNKPRVLSSDISALSQLKYTEHSISTLPSAEKLQQLETTKKMKMDDNFKFVSFVFVLSVLGLLISLGVGYVYIAAASVALIGAIFLTKDYVKNQLREYLEDADINRQIKYLSENFTEVKTGIDNLVKENPGILGRLKSAAILTSEKHKDFFSSLNEELNSRKRGDILSFYLNWHRAIALYHAGLSRDLNSNHLSPYSGENDYIFGRLYGSMDVRSMGGHAVQLDDQFEHHVNRIIKKYNGRFPLHGCSYEDPYPILSKLRNIAKIELYSSGNAGNYDMNYLQMRVMLQDGFLDFTPTWTIYKEIRASEVIFALSALKKLDVLDKTFITGNGESRKCLNDFVGLTLEVFDLIAPGRYDDETIKQLIERQLSVA